MAEFRRRVSVPRRALTDGVNGPFDLGVNPISHLILHLDGVVAGAAAVGVRTPYADLDNVTVALQGASVINLQGEDLQAAVAVVLRHVPYVLNHSSATNGDLVRLSIPVPFGRRQYWQNECFPATKKGDLQLQVTMSAEGATFQARNITVEAVELVGATPKRFMKMVSLTRALTATDFDFPLPIGNAYAGFLIFQPAVADAGVASGTIRSMTLLLDHREEFVIASRFEAMRDQFHSLVPDFDEYLASALPALAGYGLVDFDPLRDDEYLVESSKFEDIRLRLELDNAGSPRVIPLELVTVPGATGA